MKRVLAITALAVLSSVATACGTGGGSASPSSDSLRIVAAFYPLEYVARQVAGDTASVRILTPPGAEPHDIELSPQQVAEVTEADLVLYIPGFQPALDDVVTGLANAMDVTDGIALIGDDPHVWLDPMNMVAIGQALVSRLPGIDGIASRQTSFAASMQTLDAEWSVRTRQCTQRTLVVSHDAFAYLAAQYDFAQVGIAGLSPDAEPSPARLAEISDLVRSEGITTIYYESLVDPKVAQTIADETGAQTALLDPIEGVPSGSDATYETLMRQNLDTVAAGQGCA